MGLKIISVGKVTQLGRQQGRIGNHLAGRVQQQDIALVGRRRGTIEQHQVPDAFGNVLQVSALGSGYQAFEGHVVQFDIAQHVSVDQLRDGVGGALGRLQGVGMFTNQQRSHDPHDQQHRERAAQDQQALRAAVGAGRA